MANFTIPEPPVYTKDANIEELYEWTRELYNGLWLTDFISVQQRKKEGNEN